MPIVLNAMKVDFRPRCAIVRVAGITPQAVPITMSAIGSVAHCGSGAMLAPMMLPISIIRGKALAEIALANASSQTVRNEVHIGLA